MLNFGAAAAALVFLSRGQVPKLIANVVHVSSDISTPVYHNDAQVRFGRACNDAINALGIASRRGIVQADLDHFNSNGY